MSKYFLDIGWKSIRHAGEELCGDHVDVIDDFSFGGPFGEQDGRTAAKCLCIDLMRRDQRQNVLEHCLFAAIVGNRGSHSLLFY